MKVICPKCQYKGVVDVAPTTLESRPICPKCSVPMVDVLSRAAAARAAAGLPHISNPVAADPSANAARENHDSRIALETARAASAAVAKEAGVYGGWEAAAPARADASLTSRFAEWRTGLRQSFLRTRRPHSLTSDRHKILLLRLSPVIIILGGLIWLSLYTLSGFLTERGGELFNQVSAHQRVANNQASNQSPATETAPPSDDDEAATAEETEPSSASEFGLAEEGFTLQVGSYSENIQANEQCARLNEAGVEARMVRAEIPRRGTWYRVQVGRFTSREEAERAGEQLKSDGTAEEFIVTQVATQ